jgi:PA domain
MPTTRRRLLAAAAFGAGAGAINALLPVTAAAQTRPSSPTERIRADLERHAAFGDKFSGGPGDSANADWIAGRLRDAGYQVAVPEFDAPFFVRRQASLGVGTRTVGVDPQAPVVPTGRRGVTGRLALIEDTAGDEVGDVRGRIALIVAPFARHAALFATRGIGRTVTAAAAAGAAAIIVVTTGPSGEAVALNAPEEPFVPVPMAVLAPKSAAAFIDAARSSADATLILDGDATHRPCKNVVARMERGSRWLAMSTPRSGWYGCTAERGTGTAAFLEIADWAVGRFPDLSIFLMNTGGHEYFFAGSQRVVHEAPPPEDTLVWAHIGATLAARDAVERDGEWVMLDTADPQRSLMASAEASDAAAAAFAGMSGLEKPGIIRSQAGELSTFTDMGYRKAFAVIGLHRWFHTRLDTLETVDARLVVPVLRAHQKTIELLVEAA